MSFYLTSTVIASIVILGVLFIWIGVNLRWRQFHRRKQWRIFSLDSKKIGNKLSDFLKIISPPFVLEIVVPPLGQKVSYYLIVPEKRVKKLARLPEAKEVTEYDIYYSLGVHRGFYLRADKWSSDIDLRKIDFSKVDAVGETVTIQVVARRRVKKAIISNFRTLISAPSAYRVKEILESIKPAFSGYKMLEVKSIDFMRRLSLREFSDKEIIQFARPRE